MARNTAAQAAQTETETQVVGAENQPELTAEIAQSILEAINGHNVGADEQVEQTEQKEEVKRQITDVDLTACGTNKSAKIRLLAKEGFTRSEIATHLGIKYQFVRNVLVTKLASED